MNTHRVVLASAGTGKTFQLTNRFIRLIAAGVDPSTILATTFTRKAAGEILQRILSRLAAGAVDARALAELREHAHPELTHERCCELVALLAASVHRLNVKTLDSFFAWITGCFGLEMGVPPGWRIITDEEDADLRSQAIQLALRDADRSQMMAFLEMLSGGASARAVHDAIDRAVGDAYAAWIETAARPEAWTKFGPESEPLDDAAIRSAITTLKALEMPTNKDGAPDKRWQNAHDGNIASAREGDWDSFLSKGLASCIVRKKHEYYREAISAGIIAAYTPLVRHASAIILTEFLKRNIATRELMARFDVAYQHAKESAGAFRFEDIPRRLLRQPLDGRLDHLYYRLDARLSHILLDEFQDTSLEQFALIEPILDELLSDADGSVFIVGDVKQSLYSWRGGEPELLPNLSSRWAQLATGTLDLNFRSSPIILDTTNTVFESLADNPALAEHPEVAAVWHERFKTHRAARTKLAGTARLVIAPSAGEGASKEEQSLETLAFAAARVKAILDQQPRTRVGILVRTNRWIAQIIFELKRLGIAASEEGGNPLTDSPPVAAAISLLQLADHPGDTAALFHIATSPLGAVVGLTDPLGDRAARRTAADIRRRLMREGYAPFLRWLLLRAADAMDARGHARFQQLIDLAQEFDASAGTRPSEFVRVVQERGVRDPGRQNVSVMTIHQAKGLEFDAVILPELDKLWQLRPTQILTDRRDAEGNRSPFAPVSIATRCPGEEIRKLHSGLAELHRHWQQRQIGEELCCLYVALTRAVHVLEMIVPPPKEKESKLPLCAAGILRGVLASTGTVPGQIAWECTSEGDEHWPAQIEAAHRRAAPASALADPVRIALAQPLRIPLGRLRRRTPSSLASGGQGTTHDGGGAEGADSTADTINLADIWSAPGDTARDRGSLIHAWFERVDWLDSGLPSDEDLLVVAPGLGFPPAAAGDLLVQFKQSLTGDIASALSRTRYAGRPADSLVLRREWPFVVHDVDTDGRGSLLSGQFDRVVIGMVRGRAAWADIIDFKTDRLASGDPQAVSSRMDHYRPQIAAYRRALASLLRLPPERITAHLLFTTTNQVVALE
jgi:ATP-dependent helicase/nuclease subunit A